MPASRSLRLGAALAAVAAVGAAVAVTLVLVTGDSTDTPRLAGTATAAAADGEPGGTAEPSGSTSTGDQLNPDETELVRLLDPFSLRDCVSAATVGGIDAAVDCEADGVERVRVARYVDAAALAADVNRRAAAVEDVGSCRRGENSVEDWGRSTRRLGTFMCWTIDGNAGVFWTADEQRLGFEVSGEDSTLALADLVAWWDELEPLR